jgi:hypothetical protein
LSEAERTERLERYEQRIRYNLESLCESAKAIPWTGLSDPTKAGMYVSWWHMLTYMSVDLVLPLLTEAAPVAAKLILGGSLSREELLLLPAAWQGVLLWGVYVDIVLGRLGKSRTAKNAPTPQTPYSKFHNKGSDMVQRFWD